MGEEQGAMHGSEIDALVGELELAGARIEKVYQEDYEQLILKIYKNKINSFLVINLGKNSHLYRLANYKSKPAKPLRFKELLMSKIAGGRILQVESVPYERALVFHVKRNSIVYYLVVLLWARASNIYLALDTWHILDAFYRKKENLAQKQLQHYLHAKEHPYQSPALMRFSDNASLNDAIVAHYRAVDKGASSNQFVLQLTQLQSQLHDAQRKREALVDVATLELEITRADEAFFSKVFPLPTLYQAEFATHQRHIQQLQRNIKKRNEQCIFLTQKAAKLQEAIDTMMQNSSDPDPTIAQKQEPFLRIKYEGYTILVGKNVSQNDLILKKYSRGLDYWLHLHQERGGFVLIKYQKGLPLPANVLLHACDLAHHFSKKRSQLQVEIIFTQVKWIKRTTIPGRVEIIRAKIIAHTYHQERIDALLAQKKDS
jgi:predicted ribosome quality control (RQC) complex YloA/Tae2 family protein